MATKGAPAGKKRRFGWRTPRWKDPAFWAAVGIAAAAIALQVYVVDQREGAVYWLAMAVRAVGTWILVSALIRIRVGIRRGLVAGFEESHEKARTTSSGRTTGETLARGTGRTLGQAMSAYKRSQGKGGSGSGSSRS